MAKRYGGETVEQWRRSYAVRPPALPRDERSATSDPRYADLAPREIPLTESLEDTLDRLLPYWSDVIAPKLARGRRVIVSAHGNSLRALVKHLDRLSETAVVEVNVPVGIPLVYELDERLEPVRHFYLADPDELTAAIHAVAEEAR